MLKSFEVAKIKIMFGVTFHECWETSCLSGWVGWKKNSMSKNEIQSGAREG